VAETNVCLRSLHLLSFAFLEKWSAAAMA
jgi:hypothetical protein